MLVTDLLGPGAILSRVRVADKRALFALLAEHAEHIVGVPAATIAAVVLAREAEGTTGFGGGVALPHARLDVLAHPVGLFAQLETGIDYDALDGAPVDLVFLLLSPPVGSAEHLKALASASRMLRDRALTARLRGAGDADLLYALLAPSPHSHAA